MASLSIRDLDTFDADLEEGRRQITERRQEIYTKTGQWIDPNRLLWLRQQVLKLVRLSR
ncbi:hypothetical protein LG293_17370 (plasmid) [Citricoccus nitrophenolicus]